MDIPRKRRIKPWIITLVILLIAAAAAAYFLRPKNEAKEDDYEIYTVERGTVVATITGNGKLSPASTEDVKLPTVVKISDVPVKLGDSVKKGDVLARLNTVSLSDKAATLSAEIASLDRELAQLSYGKTEESISAPAAGRIKYMPASKDSDVMTVIKEDGALALISADGRMIIKCDTSLELALYGEVKVTWADGSDTGIITDRTDTGYTVTLDDDKIPYLAEAKIYDGERLIGSGTAEISAPIGVYSLGGKISRVHRKEGDNVSVGSKLFTVENGALSSAYKIKYRQREEKAKILQTVLSYINDPVLLSPYDGVISSVNITKGKYSAASTTDETSTAFVVNTGGPVDMTVAVNELDINSVEVGQNASLSIDALPGERFDAKVKRISRAGRPDGSLTVYDVDLTIKYDERLLQGMNCSAVITTGEAADVLMVPLAAINEDSDGEYVYIGDEKEKRYIKTGLSDGEMAEVTEGLAEGEKVEYPKAATSFFNSPYSFRSGTTFPSMNGSGGR